MRILVTGGLGTVGAGLISELRARGHHVVSCDVQHQPDEIGFSLRTDVEVPLYARCDVGDFRQLERVFERCGPFDYVYHCAAEFGRWNGEDFYETLWRTNAIGTKNVIRLQERLKFRLIHFSSSEVYGDWPDLMVETVMDEYEIKQLNDYAMSKWVNEMQIRNSALQYGTESVVVRLFNTYGPGEYYVGGNDLHTIEQLSDVVLKVTGADPKLVHHQDTEILTTKLKRVDTSKSVRDLDHKNSYSLEDGMRLTADWMRTVYRV